MTFADFLRSQTQEHVDLTAQALLEISPFMERYAQAEAQNLQPQKPQREEKVASMVELTKDDQKIAQELQ